jgi:hypothetical protein
MRRLSAVGRGAAGAAPTGAGAEVLILGAHMTLYLSVVELLELVDDLLVPHCSPLFKRRPFFTGVLVREELA